MTISVTWRNRSRVKSVVLEVDEHYVPIVCPKIQADYLLVTALLRDSVQRNAHPEYVFNKINRTDQPTMQVILNADEMRSGALLTAMGTSPAVLRDTLGQISPPETRLAYLQAGGVTIVRMLAKSNNSLPISLLFDHVRKAPGRKLVILAVDDASEYGSSERIGWIYDADHEFLNGNGIVQIAVTGRRCHDHMVRLLLAGVPEERLLCQADELEAAKTVTLTDIDTIFLLQDLTSYELALQVEGVLTKRLEEDAT
ncbi:MAG: DUF1727 domain-containing protein [Oscillospiraceae bacterium]|nr:DUF1727 domain-containing protein [Oscillospiraceae bacterium]